MLLTFLVNMQWVVLLKQQIIIKGITITNPFQKCVDEFGRKSNKI